MIKTAPFEACSAEALERVFGVHINSVVTADSCALQGGETCVASLCFLGDFVGSVRMVLPEGNIRATIDWILARYDIKTPVEDHVVFAELINIYTANFAMGMRKSGYALNVMTPDAAWREAIPSPDGESLFMRFETQEALPFAFLFLYRHEGGCHDSVD